MREIRTQNWGESLTWAPRHQIKCRASHKPPDLAVLSMLLGAPPAQTTGRSPSGLVTGCEGCTTGEMCLCESMCRKAGLAPSDVNRSRSLSNPWAPYEQKSDVSCSSCPGSARLLLLFCIMEGLMDSCLICKSQKIEANHSKSFPFYTYDSQAFASYISFAFP